MFSLWCVLPSSDSLSLMSKINATPEKKRHFQKLTIMTQMSPSNFISWATVASFCFSFQSLCFISKEKKACLKWWDHMLSLPTYSLLFGSSIFNISDSNRPVELALVIAFNSWLQISYQKIGNNSILSEKANSSCITSSLTI